MKTILKMAILPAMMVALASAAYADTTLQLGSYGTNDSSSDANTALAYGGYNATNGSLNATYNLQSNPTTTYNISPNTSWAPANPGTSWVSYANTGSGNVVLPNGFYEYTSTFNVTSAGNYAGIFNLLADDTAAVWIDGKQIASYGAGPNGTCQSGLPNCVENDPISIDIALLAGTNTITIIDDQVNASSAGVDFGADLTETPEPGSLFLLGTGLLGLAVILFRKAKPSGSLMNIA